MQVWFVRGAEAVRQWLFESRFGYFIVFCVAFTIFRNGAWAIPNLPIQLLIAKQPFHNPFLKAPDVQYLLYSPFAHYIAHLVGVYRSEALFLSFHFLIWVVGFAAVLFFARRVHGDRSARWIGLAFTLLPISTAVVGWLGFADVYTFLLGTLIAASTTGWVNGVAAVAMGFNHFEQGLVGIAALSAFQLLFGIRSRKAVAVQLSGVLLGRALVSAWFGLFDVRPNAGRLSWAVGHGMVHLFVSNVSHLQAFVYSTFALLWPVIILIGFYLWRQHGWKGALVGGLFLCLMAVGLAGGDPSRDYALIAWPLLVGVLLFILSRIGEGDARLLDWLLTGGVAAAVVVPPVMVWQGVYSSALMFDLYYAVDAIAGTHLVKGTPEYLVMPFR